METGPTDRLKLPKGIRLKSPETLPRTCAQATLLSEELGTFPITLGQHTVSARVAARA